MKKIITFAILIIVTVSVFGQNVNERNLYEKHKNTAWLIDTICGYSGQTNTWFLDYSEIVTEKNENGLATVIETLNRELGNFTWYEGYYVTLSYHDNDSLYEYKLWEWNTNTDDWNTEMSVYILTDENGLKLEYFDRLWNNDTQTFTQGNKEVYTYDENNFLITKEDVDWGWDTQIWADWKTTTYTNNDLGLCTQQVEVFATGINYLQLFYTYNLDNKLETILEQIWDYAWVDYSRTTSTYFGDGLLSEELFERFDEDWENVTKNTFKYFDNGLLKSQESHAYDEVNDVSLLYEYTYNENGDETSFLLSEWSSDSWTDFYRVSDIYDENFNQTEYYSENTDDGGNWVFFLKEEYFWNSYETSNLERVSAEIKIYPNPASQKIFVDYNSDKNTNIEIFTISGSKIKEFKNTKEIDVSDLQSGFYFIKISNQNFNYTEKIIIK